MMNIRIVSPDAEIKVELSEKDAILLSHELTEAVLQNLENPTFSGWFCLPCRTPSQMGVNSIAFKVLHD